MFVGTHNLRMDAKGRIALPAKSRAELEDGVVICRGQEHCLYVFPTAEFTRFTVALREAPLGDRRLREFIRNLFSVATEEVPDAQGRVTLPATLRSYAGLQKECVVAGVNNRLEIWSAPAWAEFLARTEDDFANISEEVLPGVI